MVGSGDRSRDIRCKNAIYSNEVFFSNPVVLNRLDDLIAHSDIKRTPSQIRMVWECPYEGRPACVHNSG